MKQSSIVLLLRHILTEEIYQTQSLHLSIDETFKEAVAFVRGSQNRYLRKSSFSDQ